MELSPKIGREGVVEEAKAAADHGLVAAAR